MYIKLYLDIDGVLIGRDNKGNETIIPNAEEFLKYCLDNYECYWLSTHSRYDKLDIVRYLNRFFNKEAINLINQIKPLFWKTLKTEVIEFNKMFIWIDDDPLQIELDVLKRNNCIDSWLYVNSYENINMLTIDMVEKKKREIISKWQKR